MSQFIFHPEAVKDLEDIWDYVATENLEAADRVTRRDLRYDQVLGAVPLYRSCSS